jgi:hypothetical protein
LRSLVLDPFYGVQGKFLRFFGVTHEMDTRLRVRLRRDKRIDTSSAKSRRSRMTRI